MSPISFLKHCLIPAMFLHFVRVGRVFTKVIHVDPAPPGGGTRPGERNAALKLDCPSWGTWITLCLSLFFCEMGVTKL